MLTQKSRYFLHSTAYQLCSKNAVSVKAAPDAADAVRLQRCLRELCQTGLSLHFKSARIPQDRCDLSHTFSFFHSFLKDFLPWFSMLKCA